MAKVLFILGGGSRIGHSVATRFLREGYKVAIGRRTIGEVIDQPGLEGVVFVVVDLTDRTSVETAFQEVESKIGIPNVVVYNGRELNSPCTSDVVLLPAYGFANLWLIAAALTFPSDVGDPFMIRPSDFEQNLAVNVSGAYAALHYSTRGFLALKETGSDELPKVFIETGNVTPFQPNAAAITLGSGKAALAYLVQVGAETYADHGFR